MIMLTGLGGAGKSTAAACLRSVLCNAGYECELVELDALRKKVAPLGIDPFDGHVEVKRLVYRRIAETLEAIVGTGKSVVVDACISIESIRLDLKRRLPAMRLIHIDCPMWLAILRETERSLCGCRHERGHYLYLHAILDLANPFHNEKFSQAGISYPFEYPQCADVHVSSRRKSPTAVAWEIVRSLRIPMMN